MLLLMLSRFTKVAGFWARLTWSSRVPQAQGCLADARYSSDMGRAAVDNDAERGRLDLRLCYAPSATARFLPAPFAAYSERSARSNRLTGSSSGRSSPIPAENWTEPISEIGLVVIAVASRW